MDKTVKEVYQVALNRLCAELANGPINLGLLKGLVEATEALSDQCRQEYGR